MHGDIARELWYARKSTHDELHGVYPGPHPGGGNVLAAIGLMCYAEVVGGLMDPNAASDEQRWLTTLKHMGRCYVDLAAKHTRKPTAHEIFRHELVHRYSLDRSLGVYMFKGRESCGIGYDEDAGQFFIVVERFFDDFARACRMFYAGLR